MLNIKWVKTYFNHEIWIMILWLCSKKENKLLIWVNSKSLNLDKKIDANDEIHWFEKVATSNWRRDGKNFGVSFIEKI